MAYAYDFPGINAQLGGGQGSDQDPASQIFGNQGTTNGSGSDQQQADGSQSKTSDSSSLSGSGSGGAATSTGGDATTTGQPATQVDQADAVSRNVGQQSQPKAVAKAQGDLQTAQQSFQNEANSYLSNAANQNYNVDHSQIDQAIGGDSTALDSVKSRLTQALPDQVSAFTPTTNTDISDIDQLRTNAGVEGLLRRDADPNYSQGEAAFDMSVLGRDPQFNQIRAQLLGQQQGLQDTAAKDTATDGTGLQTQAQNTVNTNYAAGTTDADNYLTSKGSGIQSTLAAQAAAENQARAALQSGGDKTYTSAQSKAVLDALVKQYGTDPTTLARMQPYLTNSGVDASKYFGVGGNLTGNDLATSDQANQFNTIMGLLGKSDSMQAGAGAGSRESFDAANYQKAVVAAAQAQRQAADAKLQAQINQVMAAAKARVSAATPWAGGQKQAYIDQQTQPIVNQLIAQYGIDKVGPMIYAGRDGYVDPSQYYKQAAAPTDWTQYLNQADINSLSQAYKGLGQADPYKVGSYSTNGAPAPTFDSAAYMAALQAALNPPPAPGRTDAPTLGSDASGSAHGNPVINTGVGGWAGQAVNAATPDLQKAANYVTGGAPINGGNIIKGW